MTRLIFISAAVNFVFLSEWTFSRRFLFTDCRTGLWKNIVQFAFTAIFATIYIRGDIFLLISLSHENQENKLVYSIMNHDFTCKLHKAETKTHEPSVEPDQLPQTTT